MADPATPKRYVRAPGEPEPVPGRRDEFPAAARPVSGLEQLADWKLDRAGFLKLAGFSAAGLMLSGPAAAATRKLLPLLSQPEEVTPGRETWYASVCPGCSAGCGILTRNRAGRPVKIEGNPDHPVNRGGLCAVGQASLLDLYDSLRLGSPLKAGLETDWRSADGEIRRELTRLGGAGRAVRILSRTVTSPVLRDQITAFLGRFQDGRLVEYDGLSSAAILDAHEQTHGVRVLPRYRFERAEVIVSFDADFLGTWISPVEFTRGWGAGRRLTGNGKAFSRHVQVESRLSLTGAKADDRWAVAAPDVLLVLAHLAKELGAPGLSALPPCPVDAAALRGLVRDLEQRPGRGLVISGDNRLEAQLLVNWINRALENYGTTLDIRHPSNQRRGDDRAVAALLHDLERGRVGALIVLDANPVLELPEGASLAGWIRKVPLSVSLSAQLDETAAAVHYVCPDLHPLESWGDAEPVAGVAAVRQPVMTPCGNGRSALETLARWSGSNVSALDLVRTRWQKVVLPASGSKLGFDAFWSKALNDGWVAVAANGGKAVTARAVVPKLPPALWAGRDGLALVLYPKLSQLDGRHGGNPWLQEMPDPISKVAWDNYAAVAPALAVRLKVAEGDKIRLTVGGVALDVPVHLQSGTHPEVIAVAVGYGAETSRRFAHVGPQWVLGGPSVGRDGKVGVNAAPLLGRTDGRIVTFRGGVTAVRTGGRRLLACTQAYQSMDVPARLTPQDGPRQPIVQETTLAAWRKDHAAGSRPVEKAESLYPDREYPEHRWGMAIDLSACTGCSACMVACQAENNVPVVGRDEILRERDMSWIRIDRYIAEENGRTDVIFEPMLCQHCGDAPCEPVCPVAATVTSAEGLSQQVYNRCVGTRYCENNCPYKVRRFNYFNHPHPDPVARLALNPDVTVRSRGVMEKCSFCVQRIQGAKAEAKREGRPVADGQVQTACQQSCPSSAIVFGDLKDPKSRVSRLSRDPRGFKVLGELNVLPAITYLTVVRNRRAGGA